MVDPRSLQSGQPGAPDQVLRPGQHHSEANQCVASRGVDPCPYLQHQDAGRVQRAAVGLVLGVPVDLPTAVRLAASDAGHAELGLNSARHWDWLERAAFEGVGSEVGRTGGAGRGEAGAGNRRQEHNRGRLPWPLTTSPSCSRHSRRTRARTLRVCPKTPVGRPAPCCAWMTASPPAPPRRRKCRATASIRAVGTKPHACMQWPARSDHHASGCGLFRRVFL